MTEANEKDLLRTPEDEEMLDVNVGESYIKDFEKLASKVMGQVAIIGITCGNELLDVSHR